jgi:hypothetical protein
MNYNSSFLIYSDIVTTSIVNVDLLVIVMCFCSFDCIVIDAYTSI